MKILLLTNLNNDQDNEDLFLKKELEKHFDVEISSLSGSKQKEDTADLILIRNIWPTEEYHKEWKKIIARWKKKKLKIYNPLTAKGDLQGKEYLVELYNKGYPVIPSVDAKKYLNRLPKTKVYEIKPMYGGGSEGIEKLTKQQLQKTHLPKEIIEPYEHIKEELSFYFIDNKLQHTLICKKGQRWNLKPYQPTRKEQAFAKQFIQWNNLNYSIQRIDACKTKEKQLLLLEIEDFCPFLSLQDLPNKLQKSFLKKLTNSIAKQAST